MILIKKLLKNTVTVKIKIFLLYVINKFKNLCKFIIAKVIFAGMRTIELSSFWCDDCNYKRKDLGDFVALLGAKSRIGDWVKDPVSNKTWEKNKLSYCLKDVYGENDGVDIKLPWELSRFNYIYNLNSKRAIGYIEDWIENNPFYCGPNWLIAMEVGIRAMNWLVWNDISGGLLNNNPIFKRSLTEHGMYIYLNIEKGHGGVSTNHTLSDFVGLFFIGTYLEGNIIFDRWRTFAFDGVLKSMESQVYDDGGTFEGSIAYHRLTLELFIYFTILSIKSSYTIPDWFTFKLFKMLEFTAGYLNIACEAPQIGDNDSGRILAFIENEHDHSYLLALGEKIFKYSFKSICNKKNNGLAFLMPEMDKIDPKFFKLAYNYTFKNTDKSIAFDKSGAYILKEEGVFCFISVFPLGLGGKGGHNHKDLGSICMSLGEHKLIVDPGTYCYTRNKEERDLFRGYSYHNMFLYKEELEESLGNQPLWSLEKDYDAKIAEYTDSTCRIILTRISDHLKKERFVEINNTELIVTDTSSNKGTCLLHFAPEIYLKQEEEVVLILKNNRTMAKFTSLNRITIKDYYYSKGYGRKENAQFIEIEYLTGENGFRIKKEN